MLPTSISITRIDDLLAQMRFHEVPKRALFSIPFELGKGFAIGVKGYVSHRLFVVSISALARISYGLITEQKKGSYKYFIDLGDHMEVANSRTVYLDEVLSYSYSRTAVTLPPHSHRLNKWR